MKHGRNTTMYENEEMLTVKEAADRRGVTRAAISNAIHDKRLPGEQRNGVWYVRAADVDALPRPGGPRPGARRKTNEERGVTSRTCRVSVHVEPDLAAWVDAQGGPRWLYALIRAARQREEDPANG